MNQYMRVCAEISMDAVRHNFEEMRKKLKGNQKIIAVIKADAYGHGAVPIAAMMEKEDYLWGFAVAIAEEALELRRAGIKKPILILGLVFEECYPQLAEQDIRLAISDYDSALAYAKAGESLGHPVHIHLALDTGMGRIGFAPTEESADTIQQICAIPNLEIEGMFTHFARADETDRQPALVQLQRYLDFYQMLQKRHINIPIRHCSNSAGIMRVEEAHLDVVRAGITIYGIYPSEEVERELLPLQPVMSLISHVSFVKEVPAGTAISYGGTFVTSRPSRIATIPVGYADGYPRMLSNRGHVLINGKKAPILGRICMDQFMVDVTDFPEVQKCTRVTLLGRDGQEEITADQLGDLCGRFSYELLCDISRRVPRRYLGIPELTS